MLMNMRLISACILIAAIKAALAIDCLAESLDKIAANVGSNEALYNHIEVEHHSSYALTPKGWSMPMGEIAKSYEEHTRTIKQGDLFFLRSDREMLSSNGDTMKTGVLQGFDGAKTRHIENGDLANIHAGPVGDWREFKPHVVVFANWAFAEKSLSSFLTAKTYGGRDILWTVERSEELNGVACYVLRVEEASWRKSKEERDFGPAWITRLWIAPEKNYLPLQLYGFRRWTKPITGNEHPCEITKVNTLKEVSPGLWLPTNVTQTVYDYRLLDVEGNVSVTRTWNAVVDKVDTDPTYPVSFFQDIPFPPGTPVYEVDNGVITGSRITPRPPGGGVSATGWWLIGVNVVLLPLLCWVADRRQRKGRPSTLR